MAFLSQDDEELDAVLNFVDDFADDVSLPQTAITDDVAMDHQPRDGLLTIEDTELQTNGDHVATPVLRRSSRLSKRNTGAGNTSDNSLSGRNARKWMLRKAGVYADPNRARNERKVEIAYLREKVGQLETELSRLQEHTGRAIATALEMHSSGIFSRNAVANSKEEQLWEGFAAQQKDQREKAERENVRLKLVLEGQIKVAKSLEGLLRKRAQQQISECAASVQRRIDGSCPSGRTLDFRADAADFQELLQYLDDAYSQVDAVLAANGLAWKEMTLHDVQMREGVHGMYLEVFSNKVMPFGLHTTAEVTWNYFKGSKKHRGTLYAKEAQNLDTPYTVIEHFSKELVAGNSSTDVRIKQIVRRYVEAHREIVVWVASITPVDTTQSFGGFTSRHRSYAVIKRAKASTPQHEMSLLQIVSHGMLDTQSGAIHDPKYVRTLTDFLLNDAARNIKADQQLIENVLMDQMLQP